MRNHETQDTEEFNCVLVGCGKRKLPSSMLFSSGIRSTVGPMVYTHKTRGQHLHLAPFSILHLVMFQGYGELDSKSDWESSILSPGATLNDGLDSGFNNSMPVFRSSVQTFGYSGGKDFQWGCGLTGKQLLCKQFYESSNLFSSTIFRMARSSTS